MLSVRRDSCHCKNRDKSRTAGAARCQVATVGLPEAYAIEVDKEALDNLRVVKGDMQNDVN